MEQQFLLVFRHTFFVIKLVISLAFTIAIWNDVRHVPGVGYFETTLIVAAVFAAFRFFDPIVEILLLVGVIALIVLVAHGHCSNPTLDTGVLACAKTGVEIAFDAITDVIHRLIGLAHHQLPEVIRA